MHNHSAVRCHAGRRSAEGSGSPGQTLFGWSTAQTQQVKGQGAAPSRLPLGQA